MKALKNLLPTDLDVLQCIYDEYNTEFLAFREDTPNRIAKIFVPINCGIVGKKLGVDGELIFSRLENHFNNKYGFINRNAASVKFFAISINKNGETNVNCVNFPYMTAVLADLQHEYKRYKDTKQLALWSFGISVLALIISILTR